MTVRQSTSRLRDLQRVASGVSIVLNELLTKSPAARRLKGDVEGSTTAALQFVQNTVTDVTGLTQGRLRAHPSHVATRSASPPSNAQAESGFVIDESTHTSNLKAKPKSGPNFESESGFSNNDERFRAGSVSGGMGASHSESVGTLGEAETEAITSPGAELLGRDDSSPVAVGERGADGAREAREDQTLEQAVEVLQQGSSEEMHGVRSNTAKKDVEKGPETQPLPVIKKRKSRQRRVPATPLGRVFGFAGLGAGLAWGSLQESARRLWEGQGSSPSVLSPFMTEQNAERLAIALCRMRGAALKVGQMLSIQDESLVPAPVLAALESVRQGADVMPQKQLNKMLDKELGPGWREQFVSFDDEPIAAASIGQVHRAVLKDGREVAMKVQYPGVASSIDSDIDNVRLLLDYTNLIPEGLYLDQAMRVAKEELRRECNYEHEATNQKRYIKLMEGEEGFHVPLVIDELSTRGVLTTELVSGVPIDKVAMMDQHIRDQVGTQLLSLTLRELFVFRFMQTDPNWGNFLYDESTSTINLIDFGAARDFPKQFVDEYLKMVLACANRDREQIIEKSISLGFLTGKEEAAMLDAHTEAAYATGEPFSKAGPFDFHNSNLPRRISELGATMLRHRLTPPPDEAYSLHRKLSGAFLACVKLSATVNCREILLNEYERYTQSKRGEGVSAKVASV